MYIPSENLESNVNARAITMKQDFKIIFLGKKDTCWGGEYTIQYTDDVL